APLLDELGALGRQLMLQIGLAGLLGGLLLGSALAVELVQLLLHDLGELVTEKLPRDRQVGLVGLLREPRVELLRGLELGDLLLDLGDVGLHLLPQEPVDLSTNGLVAEQFSEVVRPRSASD